MSATDEALLAAASATPPRPLDVFRPSRPALARRPRVRRPGFASWLLAIAVALLLSACGGGNSGERCKSFPCVFTGFFGDLDWRASEGGASGGGGSGGDAGAGAGLGMVRNGEIVVTFDDGTQRSALTDQVRGMVTIVPSAGYTGSLLVELRGRAGATYFDEGRNAFLPFPEGRVLRAMVPAITSNIGVTAFTEAAYQLSLTCQEGTGPAEICSTDSATSTQRNGAGSKALPSTAVMRAANNHIMNVINQALPSALMLDSITELPFVMADDTGAGAIPNTTRGRHGLATAAFSKQAAMYNGLLDAPTLVAIDQLSRDLRDGRLDGIGAESLPASQRTYDPHTLVSELSSALAQQTSRYGNTATRALLPPVTAFANTRYDSYYFDATLEPDGASSTIAVATESASATRNPGQKTQYAGPAKPDNRGFMLFGNMGSGALFIKTDTVDSRGRILAVGDNTNGELGDGSQQPSSAAGASLTSLPASLTHVAGGIAHSVARFADGSVFAWGDNSLGQLGQGTVSATPSSRPMPVALPAPALAVAATSQASFALLENGSVWSWGSSFGFGSLGDGTATSQRASPGPVMTTNGPLTGVIQLSARDNDAIALLSDGSVWTWGSFPSAEPAGTVSHIAAGRTVATRMTGLPVTSGGVRKVLTEQGLFAAVVAGRGSDGSDLDGATYAWGVHFDITAGTVLKDVEPRRVLNLPPVRDLMPGGFLGYGQRPADRVTGMAIDYDGGLWKVRGRVAERYDPANPMAQRRPQGQPRNPECATCHTIRPRQLPPVPTVGPTCVVPQHILDLLTSQSDCQSCHTGERLSTGRVMTALTCVPPILPDPPKPTVFVPPQDRCNLPAGHVTIQAKAACSSCHNSVVAAPLACSVDLPLVLPPSTIQVTISGAIDDAPPITGPIVSGGLTDDDTPTLIGTLTAAPGAGEYVTILRDGLAVGQAVVEGLNWQYTSPTLGFGLTYAFTARIDRNQAQPGPLSEAFTLTVSNQGPDKFAHIVSVNRLTGGQVTIAERSIALVGEVWTASSQPTTLASGESITIVRKSPNGVNTEISGSTSSGTSWSYVDTDVNDGRYVYQARVDGPTGEGSLHNRFDVLIDTTLPLAGPALTVRVNRPSLAGGGVRANGLGMTDPAPLISVAEALPPSTRIQLLMRSSANPEGKVIGELMADASGSPPTLTDLVIEEAATHAGVVFRPPSSPLLPLTPPDGNSITVSFLARILNAAGTPGPDGPTSTHAVGLFSCAELLAIKQPTPASSRHEGSVPVGTNCGNSCHQMASGGVLQGLPGSPSGSSAAEISAAVTWWCTHDASKAVKLR